MSVRAVLNELMPLLEPNDAHRDDSRARPVNFDQVLGPLWSGQPGVLYGWPRSERFTPESNELDREDFSIRLAWAVDASIEVAAGDREQVTSEILFDRADAISALVRANRAHNDASGAPVWEHIGVTRIDYETLVTNSARGLYLDLDGYTLRS